MIKKVIVMGLGAILFGSVVSIYACAPETGTDGGSEPSKEEIVDMIDDLEDGDDVIIITEQRSGDWYTYNDGSADAVQTPAGACNPSEGGMNDSQYAMNTQGNAWTLWGAGIGFDFNPSGMSSLTDGGVTDEGDGGAVSSGLKGSFDASAYKGITFSVKGTGNARAQILIPGLIAESEGGTCVEGESDAEQCSNGYGISIVLNGEWTQYALEFATITQDDGWGQVVEFDVTQLVSLLWHIPPNENFDLWIDDIGFY